MVPDFNRSKDIYFPERELMSMLKNSVLKLQLFKKCLFDLLIKILFLI